MKKKPSLPFFAGCLAVLAAFALTKSIAAEEPQSFQVTIDPNLSEIVVTFDRPMQGGYSFVGGGRNYPETLGKPVYSADRKTITLRVKLKPAWRYEFWLNRGRFDSFRSEDGVALDPVHVEFRTTE